MITLDRLNRKEAIRYLGGAGISLNYRMDVLMDECEKEILKTAEPRFLYVERKAPFDDILLGNDIKKHLEGCHTAVMMCATIGSEILKLGSMMNPTCSRFGLFTTTLLFVIY